MICYVCLLFLFDFYFLKFSLRDDLNVWTLICLYNFSLNAIWLSVLGNAVLHKILCQETMEFKCHCFSNKAYCCPIFCPFKLSNIDMSLSKIYFNIILSSKTVSKVITFHCDFHPKLWAHVLFLPHVTYPVCILCFINKI